jgi:hypothetical protein
MFQIQSSMISSNVVGLSKSIAEIQILTVY